jgi:hypothetical protein
LVEFSDAEGTARFNSEATEVLVLFESRDPLAGVSFQQFSVTFVASE